MKKTKNPAPPRNEKVTKLKTLEAERLKKVVGGGGPRERSGADEGPGCY